MAVSASGNGIDDSSQPSPLTPRSPDGRFACAHTIARLKTRKYLLFISKKSTIYLQIIYALSTENLRTIYAIYNKSIFCLRFIYKASQPSPNNLRFIYEKSTALIFIYKKSPNNLHFIYKHFTFCLLYLRKISKKSTLKGQEKASQQ